MSLIAFYILAILIVATSLMVVTRRSPLSSAFFLIITLFLVAVSFVTLDAHFIAAIQVIVYAGAIMVLFIFVIMMLNLKKEDLRPLKVDITIFGVLCLVGVFLSCLYHFFFSTAGSAGGFTPVVRDGFGSIYSVGEKLLSTYLLPFELASLVLLAAIIGAVVLAKRKF